VRPGPVSRGRQRRERDVLDHGRPLLQIARAHGDLAGEPLLQLAAVDLELPLPQPALERHLQLVQVDRFNEVVVRAELEALDGRVPGRPEARGSGGSAGRGWAWR